MQNRLEAPARLVMRTSLALFTGAVILLLQSAFWTDAVSSWMRAIVVAMAVLAYFRPGYGLLALAALAPLGQVGSRTLDSQMRGAEALSLAFLAGALVRGWTLHRFRSIPADTLQVLACAFALIVATSCIEQIWLLQLQRDFPAPFLAGVLWYATRGYLVGFGGLDMIFSAMLLLEGLALMIYAAHYCRLSPGFAPRLVAALVLGAIWAAGVNFSYLSAHLTQAGISTATLVEMLTQRWSFHVGDVNAAGSFFAMGMAMAFAQAFVHRRRRVLWALCGSTLGLAMWLTASRTAVLAVALIALFALAKAMLGRSIGMFRTVTVTTAVLAILAVALVAYFPSGFFEQTAGNAVRIRWLFLGTTLRMMLSAPLFGVGIGQYALWSFHFSSPELLAIYARENAHNYFAQIGGELGILGLAAFLWVLGAAMFFGSRRLATRADPLSASVLLGLSTFILTWLGGHPLLVPEVSYPFWLALGIVPGLLAPLAAPPRSGLVFAAVLTCALALSIAPRVAHKAADIDFTKVTYGLSDQLITSRGRFFIAPGGSQLRIPLRARTATPDAPVVLDLFVDEQPAATVTLTDSGWVEPHLALSPAAPAGARRARRVDLRIRASESAAPVEVGKWGIISPDA